jgi:peptide/nickel transport system permease protein
MNVTTAILTPQTASPAARAAGIAHRLLTAVWRQRQLAGAVAVFSVIVLGTVFAPWLSAYDPNAIDLSATSQAPSLEHWFGTDQMGRDVLSRTLYGGRISLLIAFCAVVLAGFFGAIAGTLSAYVGGWFDNVVMRIVDAQYALPPVFLAMVVIGVLGPSTLNIIAVVTLANWVRFARIIRAEALSLRERDYVLIARLAGASPLYVAIKHLLPNVRDTFIVLLTLDIGLIVFMEAALSFLGLGVQPPDPSWGGMIAEGRSFLEMAWWTSILPGTVLMATVLSTNLIGEWFQGSGGATRGATR